MLTIRPGETRPPGRRASSHRRGLRPGVAVLQSHAMGLSGSGVSVGRSHKGHAGSVSWGEAWGREKTRCGGWQRLPVATVISPPSPAPRTVRAGLNGSAAIRAEHDRGPGLLERGLLPFRSTACCAALPPAGRCGTVRFALIFRETQRGRRPIERCEPCGGAQGLLDGADGRPAARRPGGGGRRQRAGQSRLHFLNDGAGRHRVGET